MRDPESNLPTYDHLPDAANPSQANSAKILAVIVTRHRPVEVLRSISALAAQTRRIQGLVIVDNGLDAALEATARQITEPAQIPLHYIPSTRNLGGAGGFALGILHALALGADFVWLADDDGRAGGDDALAALVTELESRKLGMISPVVVDMDRPDRLAFPTRRSLRRITTASNLVGPSGFLPGFAALFNGALFSADTLDRVGVPDYRLFIRGDEIEIDRRLKRSGIAFGTTSAAQYLHPTGATEFVGALNVELPTAGFKNYYTFRNRGYLTNQPGKRIKGSAEFIIYMAYFLLKRRSVSEFFSWFQLMRQGRSEKFLRYSEPVSNASPAERGTSEKT